MSNVTDMRANRSERALTALMTHFKGYNAPTVVNGLVERLITALMERQYRHADEVRRQRLEDGDEAELVGLPCGLEVKHNVGGGAVVFSYRDHDDPDGYHRLMTLSWVAFPSMMAGHLARRLCIGYGEPKLFNAPLDGATLTELARRLKATDRNQDIILRLYEPVHELREHLARSSAGYWYDDGNFDSLEHGFNLTLALMSPEQTERGQEGAQFITLETHHEAQFYLCGGAIEPSRPVD